MTHIEIVFAISLEVLAFTFGAVLMAVAGYQILIKHVRGRTLLNPEGLALIIAGFGLLAVAVKAVVITVKTGAGT